MNTKVDDILEGLKREKWAIEATDEMTRRKGLRHGVGRAILAMARVDARQKGRPLDMVLVANAIKYAGDNKEKLKHGWR